MELAIGGLCHHSIMYDREATLTRQSHRTAIQKITFIVILLLLQ